MTAFDIAVLSGLTFALLMGFWRGFVSELLSLLAWVVAFFAARAAASPAGALVAAAFRDQAVQYVIGFAAVFIGVIVLFALLRIAIRGVLAKAGLGLLDRLLGAVFSGVQGLALIVALTLIAGLTKLPQEQWWRDSLLAPALETAALAAKPYLPVALAQRIRYR